jgi:hypothetical protein
MTGPQRAPLFQCTNVVDAILTDARIDSLNAKLVERGISADQVIAILPVEPQLMVTPTPRYRVLYRPA